MKYKNKKRIVLGVTGVYTALFFLNTFMLQSLYAESGTWVSKTPSAAVSLEGTDAGMSIDPSADQDSTSAPGNGSSYSACTMTLNKATYNVGDMATLTWSGAFGTKLSFGASDGWSPGSVTSSSGSIVFKIPTNSVHYSVTLAGLDEGGALVSSCTANATVNLPIPPMSVSSGGAAAAGHPTTSISWVASGATSIHITSPDASVKYIYTQTGSFLVTPPAGTIASDYTIVGSWPNGTVNTKTLTIAYNMDAGVFSGKTTGPNVTGSFALGGSSLASRLGVVVNKNDPLSVQIGNYYIQAHGLSSDHLFTVSLPYGTGVTNVSTGAFTSAYASLLSQMGTKDIQMFALTWAAPYKVNNCISITSAFAFGYTGSINCNAVQYATNPLYDSESTSPYTTAKIRPMMAVAALTFDDAKKLIDRGVAAQVNIAPIADPTPIFSLSMTKKFRSAIAMSPLPGNTVDPGLVVQVPMVSNYHPNISAYFERTSDSLRSLRDIDDHWATFAPWLSRYIPTYRQKNDSLTGASNIMFYFTGLAKVNGIAANAYAPGAVADHLTSYGGMLTDSPQMSSLRWLEAGATASYGTVIEPYAYWQKFPKVSVMVRHYMAAEPVGLAYFKSVLWPAQGIFIGDPLASPFPGYQYSSDADKVFLNIFGGTSTPAGLTLMNSRPTSGDLPSPSYTLSSFIPGKTEFIIPAKIFSFDSLFSIVGND